MTENQLLNQNQINDIMRIARRDHISPAIDNKIKEIKETEEYKTLLENVKSSKEGKEALKVLDLVNKIKDITKAEFYIDVDNMIAVIDSNSTIDTIFEKYIFNLLNIREIYSIVGDITDDIETRLQLVDVASFEELIEKEVIPYINVDKYLYKK